MRRLVLLVPIGIALELGWLALWTIGAPLTHSAAFTSAASARFPAAAMALGAIGDPGQATASWAWLLAADLAAIGLGYVVALVQLARGAGASRAAPWLVLGFAVLFQATLALSPVLFSQDLFGYAAYGRLSVEYGLNPYVWPPSTIDKDPVVSWVADVWRTYAAPYGPVWLDVQAAMDVLTGATDVLGEVIAYRLLGSVLLLVNLALAWRIIEASRAPRSEKTAALAALAWNPLLLFEFAGNAHNDVLMLTFGFLAAGWLLSRPSFVHALAAALAFTAGALVKDLSGVGTAWLLVAAVAWPGRWRRRAARAFGLALACGALALAASWPWLELPDSLDPILNETIGVGYVNALPDVLTLAIVPAGAETLALARHVERVLALAIFAAYGFWELRRVWSDPSGPTLVRASVRSSLLYVVIVSTSVQAWYFAFPAGLAVLLGWRSRLARVAIGYSLLALPVLYLAYYLREQTPLPLWLVYGLGPWLVFARAVWSRAAGRLSSWLGRSGQVTAAG